MRITTDEFVPADLRRVLEEVYHCSLSSSLSGKIKLEETRRDAVIVN